MKCYNLYIKQSSENVHSDEVTGYCVLLAFRANEYSAAFVFGLSINDLIKISLYPSNATVEFAAAFVVAVAFALSINGPLYIDSRECYKLC